MRDAYEAATGEVAFHDRPERAWLRVSGRAPAQMLDGILTSRIPPAPSGEGGGGPEGEAAYALVLTPKGRTVTDLRVFRERDGDDGEILLDVPPDGRQPLLDHFGRYLPPRFARVEDRSDGSDALAVLGPGGPAVLAEILGVEEDALRLHENRYRPVSPAGSEGGLLVLGSAEVGTPVVEILGGEASVERLRAELLRRSVPRVEREVWETLRVEAGRPAFGKDLDDTTIPVEAGVHRRAIDPGKGCYTGQEVIVRIRDRGHVNRHLRGLLFDGTGPPPPGTELFVPERERAVGRITSAVRSPRYGRAIGLGYVRREVDPPAEVRLGGPDGPPVGVRDLETDWGPQVRPAPSPAPG